MLLELSVSDLPRALGDRLLDGMSFTIATEQVLAVVDYFLFFLLFLHLSGGPLERLPFLLLQVSDRVHSLYPVSIDFDADLLLLRQLLGRLGMLLVDELLVLVLSVEPVQRHIHLVDRILMLGDHRALLVG